MADFQVLETFDSIPENTGYYRTWLLKGVTTRIKVFVKPGYDNGLYDPYNELSNRGFTGYASPGAIHPFFSGVNPMICDSCNIVAQSANCFISESKYEGSTGNILWTANGGLTQEQAALDYLNNPCIVPIPSTILESAKSASMDRSLLTDKISLINRYFGQVSRTLSYYDTNPLFNRGEYIYAQNLYRLLATTNANPWGRPDQASPSNPRTWMVSSVSINTNNNVLFRIDITFTYREKTWDEIALWLDENGNVWTVADESGKQVPDIVPPIPAPNAFPTSKLGLDGTAQGWGRFIMSRPASWVHLFPLVPDTNRSQIPQIPIV